MFKALVLRDEDGKTLSKVEELNIDDLPKGDVLVEVEYSSLNYKDGLAVTGTGKIIRDFPMVPGIDFAGKVLESGSNDFKVGDSVVLTGWGVGENHWGGFSQKARLKSKWLVPMPEGGDAPWAMSIGTAGLTAMLSVMALEGAGVMPDAGVVVVTGATGGVGSTAVSILNKLGYKVAAVTGSETEHEYLRCLGASEILSREEMAEKCRPLENQRWAGAIDTVGDAILARVLAETNYGGAVAACGLAAGYKLPSTVMPFILRGVSLLGIDSVACPIERRIEAWKRLRTDIPTETLTQLVREISLDEVPEAAAAIIKGQIRGRTLIDVNR
ncbi:MAG: MDR family oxidoreductase [Gammaproteobacteria bacterium]